MLRDSSYSREQVLESLTSRKYDDVMAFYLLLGLRSAEVNIDFYSNMVFYSYLCLSSFRPSHQII